MYAACEPGSGSRVERSIDFRLLITIFYQADQKNELGLRAEFRYFAAGGSAIRPVPYAPRTRLWSCVPVQATGILVHSSNEPQCRLRSNAHDPESSGNAAGRSPFRGQPYRVCATRPPNPTDVR